MVRGLVVLAIIGLLTSGCGAVAMRTVVVTATPAKLAAARHHRARPRTPTPAPTGGTIDLASASVEGGSGSAGAALTVDFSISNGTGSQQKVQLGATIQNSANAQESYSDPSNDDIITAKPGTHTYTRSFSVPANASAGEYDLLASVVAPGFTHTYALSTYRQAVSIINNGSTADASAPAPTNSTPPASESTSATNDQGATSLLDLEAQGSETTRSFTTSGSEWGIGWGYNCSNFGQAGSFSVDITDTDPAADFFSPGISEQGMSDSGTDYEHMGGTFYLSIISECDWHIVVYG